MNEPRSEDRLARIASAGDGTAADWLAAYFRSAAPDVLAARSDAALLAVALDHRQRFSRRVAGQGAVHVEAAEGGRVTVQTCTDDMPFLVDTVLMVLREQGLGVDWMIHPVLRVARDADGHLSGLAAKAPPGLAESWIHLECDGAAEASACERLADVLRARLAEVRLAVSDYEPMRARLHALSTRLRVAAPGIDAAELAEAREFLRWLDAGHFTLMACSESHTVTADDGRVQIVPQPAAGLGLARVGASLADTEALIAPRAELEKYAESARVVVVAKALQQATLHHADYLDVIAVKQFDDAGRVANTVRFVGLFSAEAYEVRPWAIPLIRRKVELVLRRSQLDPESHSGKKLREIIGGLPRDELFQSSEDELFRTATGIREVRGRQQLRLFLRRDRYGRFFSALVYLPRERYGRELRDRVGQELLLACGGFSMDRNVEFLRDGLARIHYQLRTQPGTVLGETVEAIEQRLLRLTRPFREQLREALVHAGAADAAALAERFGGAFAPSYLERSSVNDAAIDTLQLAQLLPAQPVRPSLLLTGGTRARLKLYCWKEPLALADVLPVLEHFGIRVVRQDPEVVRPHAGEPLWIQDFEVEVPAGVEAGAARELEAQLPEVLAQRAEDDDLNRLVLAAALGRRQVLLLRMLARYVNQIGLPYGRADIERFVATHPEVGRCIVARFEARFDPVLDAAARGEHERAAGEALDQALERVVSLDADRILRALASVVTAGLRTNFWQRDALGAAKSWISLKLDPARVPELPRPRPFLEIWVCAPQVEGVHLRGGKVARGGLRWSDRREDFRTEVLGLMKAQQVKNAVIVPVGAKGGFVVKQAAGSLPAPDRMTQGIACYQIFLRGLLDLTDNRVGAEVLPPADVVRHDADDPYLVVAADKGTATFSDIANAVAAEYGFWLGDAFASGGSVGYDHKKMGITARGAWESVKRHFREMDRDILREDFRVVGIGDMSGDVFGNGMLLSPHIRLIAAFDHRHIFIDPDPVAATSHAERQRLFALPRSSWADYDVGLISAGGGVFARSAKRIEVTPVMAEALGSEPGLMTPAELMRACLLAPVDLLWNGGIGTYVKASFESHEQVRDRANEALRVDGRMLRARVVGEGGNLGFTQAGRIEYAQRGVGGVGGRINTDAIDNSGGVHCSDREVNIKIPLNQLMASGGLLRADRDRLLADMTDDVARFVLRDNEVQSGCISLIEQEASQRLDEHVALMRRLEREGRLDRALEGLPDDEELKERRAAARGLTRPELAVLVAYSKMSLFEALLSSQVPDDPHFVHALLANFPPQLVAAHRPAIENHRLRREIVATILANAVVNRMGASFAHRLAEDRGASVAEVLAAYAAAHELLAGDDYWQAIEALQLPLPARLQLRLMHQAAALLKHVTGTLLGKAAGVGERVRRYQGAAPALEALLPAILPPGYREDYERHLAALLAEQVPPALARRLTAAKALGSALDLADLAQQSGLEFAGIAQAYFDLGERLRMSWLLGAIVNLRVVGPWQALARNKLREDAYRLHRALTAKALAAGGVEAWATAQARGLRFSLARFADLQAAGSPDYAVLAVAVRELYELQLTA